MSGLLKIEVAYPVDDIKQQEGGGEEDAWVCVQFQNIYVDSALSPGSSFAFLVAAEEALAVFSIQALV